MGRVDLDWQLREATHRGNRSFIDSIAQLRWRLMQAAVARDWQEYNMAAGALNNHGASIPLITIPKGESLQMGMFDKPQFLTGQNGLVSPGDVFWLHNAKADGTSNTPSGPREQVK